MSDQNEGPVDGGVRYLGEYQYRGDDTWYVSGDIYGYPTIEQAREVNAWEVEKILSRGTRGGIPVFATRVYAVVTSGFVVEETEA